MLKMYALKGTVSNNTAGKLGIEIVDSVDDIPGGEQAILIIPEDSELISAPDITEKLHNRGIIVTGKKLFDRLLLLSGNDPNIIVSGILGFNAFARGIFEGMKEVAKIRELEEMWEKSSDVLEEDVKTPVFKGREISISVDKGQAQFSSVGGEHRLYMLVKVRDTSGRLIGQGILKGVMDKAVPESLRIRILEQMLLEIKNILQRTGEFNEGRISIKIDGSDYKIHLKDVSGSVGETLLVKHRETGRLLDRKDIMPDEEEGKVEEISGNLLFMEKEV